RSPPPPASFPSPTLFRPINLLGSVRAWRGNREFRLGPPQQRSVLVLLAIAHGQPVPVHEIIEALWEGSSPASAVNVIQTYLKRLDRKSTRLNSSHVKISY